MAWRAPSAFGTWAVVATCFGACGRIEFDPSADALAPFGTPALVAELADPSEDDDPTVTDDLLEIYWEATRLGGYTIMRSTRSSPAAAWSTPAVVPEFMSGASEACPEISPDGLTMIFSSARAGGLGGYDFYISTRPTRAGTWSTPVAITELNSVSNDYCAVIADSGLEVFFHSERAGSRDLYHAVRADLVSAWSAPILITELNTPMTDESAFPLPGALELMFGSDAAGSRDLYRAVRPAAGQPFGTAIPVEAINTTADESDAWISRDGRTLFFSTNRSGNGEIYEATR